MDAWLKEAANAQVAVTQRVSSDQDRINAVGNVVVPLMAFYAMQILLQHA